MTKRLSRLGHHSRPPRQSGGTALEVALEKLAVGVRTFRLTEGEFERHGRIIEELMVLMERALIVTEKLVLPVSPFSLTYKGNIVYEELDRAESLAFRLFRDGVDSLVIERTLNSRELGIFMDILATPPGLSEKVGEDVVTSLWSSRISSIWVTDRPWFSFRLMDHSVLDSIELKSVVSDAMIFFNAGTKQPTAELEVLHTPAELDLLDKTFSHDLDVQAPLSRPCFGFEGAKSDSFRLATSHALQGLSDLIRTALIEDDEANAEALMPVYLVSLKVLLSFGEETALRRQFKALTQVRGVSRAREKTLSTILEKVASPRSLKQLLVGLRHLEVTKLTWVPLFFAEYTRASRQDFVPLFKLNLSAVGVSFLVDVIWALGEEDPSFWGDLLGDLHREVAPDILVRTIGRGSPDFVGSICAVAMSHSSAEVRCLAIEHLPEREAKRGKTKLFEMLRDSSSQVRVAAIKRLVSMGDGGLGIFLVQHLRKFGLLLMPHLEQRELLSSLVTVGGGKYVELILGELDRIEEVLRTPQELEITHAEATRAGQYALEALGRIVDLSLRSVVEERFKTAPETLLESYSRAVASLIEKEREYQTSLAGLDVGHDTELSLEPKGNQDAVEGHEDGFDELLLAYINEDSLLQSMLTSSSSTASSGYSSDEGSSEGQRGDSPSPLEMDALLKAYLDPSQSEMSRIDAFFITDASTPDDVEDGLVEPLELAGFEAPDGHVEGKKKQ